MADPEMTHINAVLWEFYEGVRNVTGLTGKSRSSTSRHRTVPPSQSRAATAGSSTDDPRRQKSRAQQIIGYGLHDAAAVGGGYLGCVGLRDPVDLLNTGQL